MNASNSQDPWDWLADQLEKFLDAWEAHQEGNSPPTLKDYLGAPLPTADDGNGPPESDDDFSESFTLRRTLLVEMVKADIEYRLACDEVKSLETYQTEHLQLDPLPTELIYEDFRLRRSHLGEVSADDYFERFPQQAEELRRLMGLDLPNASLTLYRTPALPSFHPGELVADDFRIISLLGEGSFAKVYLAQQESHGRMVALKTSANRGEEARMLVRLDHTNIVRVYDQRDVPEENMRLLYMEYAPGGTLHDVVAALKAHKQEQGPEELTGAILTRTVSEALQHRGVEPTFPATLVQQSWSQTVCEIGVQLASALDHASEEGVLHRDIKPANILISAHARPKLADFNVSFHSQLTGTAPAAYFGGSLAYMSPEQLRACNLQCEEEADSLDHRSDIYSLAVVLWELLHGERPFFDEEPTGDWTELVSKMTMRREAGPPRGASGGNPLSRDLQRVLSKCLHPDRDQRCETGEEMARELQLCLNPHAGYLVNTSDSKLKQWVLRMPTMAVLATVLLPNLLAGVLNLVFNWRWIERHAGHAEASFLGIQSVINLTAFPLGLLLMAKIFSPVADAIKKSQRDQEIDDATQATARRLSLRIGVYGTWLGVGLWTIAAILYPVLIHLWTGSFPWNGYLIFIADLIACGLIAGSYPFFLGTLLATRAYYPALLDFAELPDDEEEQLRQVGRNTGIYLLISAGVPMLALLVSAPLVIQGQELYQVALVGLVISGLIGLFAAWQAHLKIQQDLEALCYAVSPITPT